MPPRRRPAPREGSRPTILAGCSSSRFLLEYEHSAVSNATATAPTFRRTTTSRSSAAATVRPPRARRERLGEHLAARQRDPGTLGCDDEGEAAPDSGRLGIEVS